ncbi:MAG: peptide-N-glycosidase F-related protein [Candidatus Kapaibacterium sp.]
MNISSSSSLRSLLFSLVLTVFFIGATPAFSADGDTIKVRPIEFLGNQKVWFVCPPKGVHYQKVLMNYKLRCPPGKPCGEWDYLYYVFITKPNNPQRYEIMRYISPYGNGLSLGSGFTWTMDVTDFSSLLHDSVFIDANMRNPWDANVMQEDLELTFDFIVGTPPHEVLNVIPLWDGNPQYGQPTSIENFLTPKKGYISKDVKGAKLRVTQTGHGFGQEPDNCAEFCDKIQYIKVRGDLQYSRHVWRETCGLNPVPKQGGTWVYSRSNWCPGAEVTPFDYDLTPFLKPDDSLDIDVDMEDFTFPTGGQGTPPNYVITSYLFTYGAPSFTNDVSLERIIAPTKEDIFKRRNPICGSPIIMIRNTGSQQLTSVDITYGLKGVGSKTYTWKGNLDFMQEVEVTLPSLDLGTTNKNNTFEVTLSNPNGKKDEYAVNNYGAREFVAPPTYPKDVEIRLKTNKNAAQQYQWTVKNSNGDVIAEGKNYEDNKTYTEKLSLEDGCYEFRFTNNWHYGLDWWATRSQLGSGSLSLGSGASVLATFDGDFGTEVYQQFRIAPKPEGTINLDTMNFGTIPMNKPKRMTAEVTPKNNEGLQITSEPYVFLKNKGFTIVETIPALDSTGKVFIPFGETFQVVVEFAPTATGAFSAKLNIPTNSDFTPTLGVRLVGTAGPVGVEEYSAEAKPALLLEAAPNTVSTESIISFGVDSPTQVAARLALVNNLGQEVAVLFNGNNASTIEHVTLNGLEFPSGMYHLSLRALGSTTVIPIAIIH